jgi:hypothetical protein
VAGWSGERALNSFCSIINRYTENAQAQSLLCLRLKIRRPRLRNLAGNNSRIQRYYPRSISKNGVLYGISISGSSASACPFLDSWSFHYVKRHGSRNSSFHIQIAMVLQKAGDTRKGSQLSYHRDGKRCVSPVYFIRPALLRSIDCFHSNVTRYQSRNHPSSHTSTPLPYLLLCQAS